MREPAGKITIDEFVARWQAFYDRNYMSERDFRSFEEVTAEVMGRYSVTDLREQSEADLVIGDTLFYKAKTPLDIIDQGETNLVRWWKVLSGEHFYEVRRFKNFVWCSCKGFFFSKRMCKHLALTAGVYCERCRVLRATNDKLCYDCHVTATMFFAQFGTVAAVTKAKGRAVAGNAYESEKRNVSRKS